MDDKKKEKSSSFDHFFPAQPFILMAILIILLKNTIQQW